MKPTIGMFKGKLIEGLTRDEFIEFAKWAADRIQYLEKICEGGMNLMLSNGQKLKRKKSRGGIYG